MTTNDCAFFATNDMKSSKKQKKGNANSNKPRRPLTAYNFFFHEERQKLQEQLFRITGQRPTYTKISKLVGANWKKIDAAQKAYYEALAIKDKRRYALELVHHRQTQEQQGIFLEDSGCTISGDSNSTGAANALPSTFQAASSSASKGPFHLPPMEAKMCEHNSCSPYFSQLFRESATHNINNVMTMMAKKNGCDCDGNTCVPTSASCKAIMLGDCTSPSELDRSAFLSTENPEMISQMALLSVMMIDYVRKVMAPERIGNIASTTYTAAGLSTKNNDITRPWQQQQQQQQHDTHLKMANWNVLTAVSDSVADGLGELFPQQYTPSRLMDGTALEDAAAFDFDWDNWATNRTALASNSHTYLI